MKGTVSEMHQCLFLGSPHLISLHFQVDFAYASTGRRAWFHLCSPHTYSTSFSPLQRRGFKSLTRALECISIISTATATLRPAGTDAGAKIRLSKVISGKLCYGTSGGQRA